MGHRILLAEDNRLNRLATQAILQKIGYETVAVSDGREAVEAEASGDFQAVIMDSQMPTMDGFQATAEIRRREAVDQSARTPIIGLSARTMEGDHDTAIANGMDAYLTKPLMVADLRATLQQLTGQTPPAG